MVYTRCDFILRYMKIAIIGTHSTGKTTLIRKLGYVLEAHGYEIKFLEELSRKCPMPINEHTSFEAQLWIQTHQIREEHQLAQDNTVLLCDRSTLDNFAYLQRSSADKDLSEIEHTAADHMQTYDIIFKTYKLDIAAKEDGVRSTNDIFRDDIDTRILNLMATHDIPYHTLPASTDYNEHVQYILHTIQQHERLADEHVEQLQTCPIV